jgi:uncharacterized protein YutE (UPF0331/DUF86 family)
MNQAYLVAIDEHVNEHIEALLDLSEKITQRPLDFHERNSAQRSMQVLVESVIGLSKHVCKKAGKQTLGSAYANAIKALELIAGQPIKPEQLQGAIGMRNAIVHDYLNLDWKLLEQVLKESLFMDLLPFIKACASYLES